MVISPLLRGLFGLQSDAIQHKVVLSPHIPADWTWFAIHNVRVGDTTLSVKLNRTFDDINLSIQSSGTATFEFSPSVSPRAQIIAAELNGKRTPFQTSRNDVDQHVTVKVLVSAGKSMLRIRLRDDFGLTFNNVLPYLGSPSQSPHVVSEKWSPSRDTLTLRPEGLTAAEYELAIWNSAQITSVEGAEVRNGKLVVQMSANPHELSAPQTIVVHFARR
jgi:hypothetical protein